MAAPGPQPPNVPNARILNIHELDGYNALPTAEQRGYLLFAFDVISRAKSYRTKNDPTPRTQFERGKHSLKLIRKWNALTNDADGKGAWIPGWVAAEEAEEEEEEGVTEEEVEEEQQRAMREAADDERRREEIARPVQSSLPDYVSDDGGAMVDQQRGAVSQLVEDARRAAAIAQPMLENQPGEVGKDQEENQEPFSPTENETFAVRTALRGDEWQYVKALYVQDIQQGVSQARSPQKSVLLWVSCDKDTGKITDRVVVKRIDYSTKENAENEMYHEIGMHQLLETPCCENILKTRGSYWREETKVAMLYLTYAAGIDLERVINLHYEKADPIPEAFIWFVFDGLADALMSITTGVCPEKAADESLSEASTREWEPCYHLDIKPANIFLGERREPYYAYFTPLLSDFGLAVTESYMEEDKNGAHGPGTLGYQPPEQYTPITQAEKEDPRGYEISPKADIYSLGVTIWMLMQATRNPDDVWRAMDPKGDIFYWNDPERRTLPFDHPHRWAMYSKRLVRLVSDCLHMYPPDRVDNETLKRRTAEGFAWIQETYGTLEFSKQKWDDGLGLPWGFSVYFADDQFEEGTIPPAKRRKVDNGPAQGDAGGGA
ncbi:kinase-like protein [Lophium mytilinum]|uniref:non-specific serine/threonine protein kinase n=1 Tax=Lophium mytilinum TaxID=390894 RepID=A0A6A6QIP4_9PEZI|nr:kinase-like protein [Lophium mytilinum]